MPLRPVVLLGLRHGERNEFGILTYGLKSFIGEATRCTLPRLPGLRGIAAPRHGIGESMGSLTGFKSEVNIAQGGDHPVLASIQLNVENPS